MPKFKISSCTVQKLDGEDIIIDIKNLKKGQDLLDEVCKCIGIEDHVHFGLRYIHPRDEKISWFDVNKPLKKQLRKASHRFRFGVQFYPANHNEIKHDFTRYQFVLQAREHFLTGHWSCSIPTQALLASYIAQAEFGNYDSDIHEETYLNDLFFIPQEIDGFVSKVCNFHQKHNDMSPYDVDYLYLENAQKTGLYGMELYDVWDKDENMMKFGITPHGIHVLHMNTILHTFLWPSVERCVYKKKDILIKLKVGEKTVPVTFLTSSGTEAKRIVENCVLVKYFSINGERKIIKRSKSQPVEEDSAHNELGEKQFTRVDSKRFSKRFVERKDSLTLNLGSSCASTPAIEPKSNEEPAVDCGNVYLGYSDQVMQVPTITQTAPSEQSLSMLSDEEEETNTSPNKEDATEGDSPAQPGSPTHENVSPVHEPISPVRKPGSPVHQPGSPELHTKSPKDLPESAEHQPDSAVDEPDSAETKVEEGLGEEHVEIIEIVEIEYVTNARSDSSEANYETTTNTDEREEVVTSKVVEIKIVTTDVNTTDSASVESNENTHLEGESDAAVIKTTEEEEPEAEEEDQEIVIICGNETIESIEDKPSESKEIATESNGIDTETKGIDTEPTLLQLVEKELHDNGYDIVEEQNGVE